MNRVKCLDGENGGGRILRVTKSKNDDRPCIQNSFYVKLTPTTLYNRLYFFVDQLGKSSARG